MKLKTVAIAAPTFACAALLSISSPEQGGVSLSVESAQARVGRPFTPVSVAGVARRQARRGVYGAGAVGAGAVAVGTAAAVAATSPGWGWGGNPYYSGGAYYSGDPYYTEGPHAVGPYHAAGPYYGGGAWTARAYYAPPATTANAPPWDVHAAYHADGPWYGYSGWNDYKARNGIACDPGSIVRTEDGIHYFCQ